MTTLTLYAIADQYIEACEKLRDSDLPYDVIEDTIEGLPDPFEDKARSVACVIESLEDEEKILVSMLQKIDERIEQKHRRIEWLKSYLLRNMQRTGITKIESPVVRITVRKNPVKVQIASIDSIPKEYWIQKPAPNPEISRTLIKAAIESGQPVPGAYLTQDERIEIK